MAYLVPAEFKTHVYAEIVTEITRGDATIADSAIAEAIKMTKGYLSRFDLNKLFNDAAVGFVTDENLKAMVKDIAIWRMIRLSNPNLSIEIARTNFEDAIKWLKDVQKGDADPEGWPYKADDAATGYPEGSAVSMTSNTARNNHY